MPKFVEFCDSRGHYIYNINYIRSIERATYEPSAEFYLEFSDGIVRTYTYETNYDALTAFNHILKTLIN